MSAGLTPWFPVSIDPVRTGCYAVHCPEWPGNLYSYWTGSYWLECSRHPFEGHRKSSYMYAKNVKWRGLASDPAKRD